MLSVPPKFKILVPQFLEETNTSAHTERVIKLRGFQGTLMFRHSKSQEDPTGGGTMDRPIFGNFTPSDSNRPRGLMNVVLNPEAGVSSPILFIGPFELVCGRDYVVGGTEADTATNIATAISNIPGYDATPVGTVVEVFGPRTGVDLNFFARYGAVSSVNFEFVYLREFGKLGFNPINPGAPEILLP